MKRITFAAPSLPEGQRFNAETHKEHSLARAYAGSRSADRISSNSNGGLQGPIATDIPPVACMGTLSNNRPHKHRILQPSEQKPN
jgi:hypothetical protein